LLPNPLAPANTKRSVSGNLFVKEELPVENFTPFAKVVTLLIPLSPMSPSPICVTA